MTKDDLKNKVLNGGRGSGQSLRLLIEVYENQIADLQHKVDTLQGFLDHDIEYDMDKTIQTLKKENAELEKKLKIEKESRIKLVNWISKLEKKLSRAKEIIKGLLDLDLLPKVREVKQAEQFLKEIEK